MPPSKGLKSWIRPKSKREQQQQQQQQQTLTPQEQEERNLQRAIALSQRSLQEENEQRARLELLAERTLNIESMELHRHHDQHPIVNGEENDQFVTLSNRVTVKKEKASPPPSSPPTPSRQRRKDKQKRQQEEQRLTAPTTPAPQLKQEEEVEEEIVFDTTDIDGWLAEDSKNDYDCDYNSETDPLASSPPSPYFHDFGTRKLDDYRTAVEQLEEDENEDEDDRYEDEDEEVDLELSLCPLCREPVPHAILYQHTLGCSGGDDNCGDSPITNISRSSSNSNRNRHISSNSTTMPTGAELEDLKKRKSSKSMAAGVLQEQKRHKSLNTSATSARRSHDHYSLHDAELEGQFDTAGFGGNVSGLSWESRGQARYR